LYRVVVGVAAADGHRVRGVAALGIRARLVLILVVDVRLVVVLVLSGVPVIGLVLVLVIGLVLVLVVVPVVVLVLARPAALPLLRSEVLLRPLVCLIGLLRVLDPPSHGGRLSLSGRVRGGGRRTPGRQRQLGSQDRRSVRVFPVVRGRLGCVVAQRHRDPALVG